MTKVIDDRTLAYSQLAALTREALEEADEVITIADNEVARDSVAQLVKDLGHRLTVEEKEDGTYLTLSQAGVGRVRGVRVFHQYGVVRHL